MVNWVRFAEIGGGGTLDGGGNWVRFVFLGRGRVEIGFVSFFWVVVREIGFVSHNCVPIDPRQVGINFGGIQILKFLA